MSKAKTKAESGKPKAEDASALPVTESEVIAQPEPKKRSAPDCNLTPGCTGWLNVSSYEVQGHPCQAATCHVCGGSTTIKGMPEPDPDKSKA